MNGRILVVKNANSTSTKFFDLDLIEPMNELNTAKGIVYCTRNGDYACTIENNMRLIIKRIENGEWYGNVDFDPCDIAHVHISSNYIAFTLRKSPSPLLIDIKQCEIMKTFPYQTCFCCISPDDKIMLIHSEKYLYYHNLPQLDRLIILDCVEIPDNVLFTKNNTQIYVLSKDTKQITFYNLILAKKHYQSKQILQDRDIIDFKVSENESMLIVCALYCVYVLELDTENKNILFKLNTSSIDKYLRIDFDYMSSCLSTRPSSAYSVLSVSTMSSKEIENKFKIKNIFTGFGCTLNNKIIYATYFTYLICFDAKSGSLLRVFQSTVAANRIVKSCSSRLSDILVSTLDDGKIILWNLASINMNSIKFDEFKIYNEPVVDCLISNNAQNLNDYKNEPDFFISYSAESPDAKLHDLTKQSTVSSILKSCTNEELDNPLTCKLKSISLDDDGKFCFLICDIDDFVGKRYPEEADFCKRLCNLIDLTGSIHRIIHQFSFIIKKNSRFELNSRFLNKINGDCFLILKTVSCLNDFDSFYSNKLDWSDFETTIKLYGPIESLSNSVDLFDEFKMTGECLNENFCINKNFIFGSLMHECNKLYDKLQPNIVKAKRYDLKLNIYDLFENKLKAIKVQLFSLNEFLTHEELSNKNALLDLKEIYNGNFLIIYSKEGTVLNDSTSSNLKVLSNPNHANVYEYDYTRFRFNRNIKTIKGAILYDPKADQVVKNYTTIFSKETNVETLIFCKNGKHVLDNCWNLYDIDTNKHQVNLLYKLAQINYFDYHFTRFLLNGRYFITTSNEKNMIYLVRCYDLYIVGSIRINGKISCFKIGEKDRTILVGTENGNVFAIKLVIDLEFYEAINTYIGYYRNYNCTSVHSSTRKTKKISTTNDISIVHIQNDDEMSDNDNDNQINDDIKRVLNSAHAHRRLISRELRHQSASNYLKSSSFLSSTSTSSQKNLNLDLCHTGMAKINLTNLTNGIRHTQSDRQTTRACIIQ
jgi:hypothetical protein